MPFQVKIHFFKDRGHPTKPGSALTSRQIYASAFSHKLMIFAVDVFPCEQWLRILGWFSVPSEILVTAFMSTHAKVTLESWNAL